jgi:hypothetical protein
MSDASNVSTGKPQVGGAIFRAPVGTTLPTNATTTLGQAFVGLGHVSSDGLTNSKSISSSDIKAWGGAVVYSAQTENTDKLKFKLIESKNAEVLKTIYGVENVTVATNGDISVNVGAQDFEDFAWVVDMLISGGKKRITVSSAKITELGDIVYKDDDVIGYEITLTCALGADGFYHHEYITSTSEE